MITDVLVIGYGNELRGDDGVGPLVARAVAAGGWPGVSALAVHQLTPELAETLSETRQAIFVDASIANERGVAVEMIGPLDDATSVGHASDPRRLLALARRLYGRCPEAWLVSIPVQRVGFGEVLSPRAEEGLAEAVRVVAAFRGVSCRA